MSVRFLLTFAAGLLAAAQPPQFSNAVRNFIKVDAPVVALVNARVIDGTGAAAKEKPTAQPPSISRESRCCPAW
jgi:hypothetical protein